MTSANDDLLHGEEAIIGPFLAPLAAGFPGALGLKDDCAVLAPTPGHEIVLKTDPVAEGIHFLHDDDPADIAWKALAVNVSDLAAKGARPICYLMALSFPEAPSRQWMGRFAEGLGQAQAAFGILLAGGDTDRRPGPMSVSITVLGEVPAGRMVRRGAAKPGDQLYVSGVLGEGALGLALRTGREVPWATSVEAGARQAAIDKYVRPQPRLALSPVVLEYARASMDLSDGLAKDLGRMCRASGCGARVRLADLPVSAVGAAAVGADVDEWRSITASGDDYEVLCAVAPEQADRFERAARNAGLGAPVPFGITRIGEVLDGDRVELIDPTGGFFEPQRTGWDHF